MKLLLLAVVGFCCAVLVTSQNSDNCYWTKCGGSCKRGEIVSDKNHHLVLNGCLTEKRTYCCKTVATNPSGSPSVIIIQGPAAPAVTTTTTPKQDAIVIKVSG